MFPTMNGQVDEMDNTSHEEPTTSSNSSCPLSVVSIPGLGVPQSLSNALRRIEVPQLDAIPILLGEADALITPIRGRERYTDDDSSLTVPHTVHTATKFPHLSRRWPSRLMRLISEKSNDDEWSAVMERLQSHPEEIAIKGPANGMNAFHAACVRYPPLHVISAMIAVSDPETIGAANANGETPLHLAADGASEDVQMLLIDCAPKAALAQDKYGDCPLHFAARSGATRHLMQALVQAAPESISIANPRGVTPFLLLPRTFLEAEDLDEIFDDENDNFRDDWDLHVLFLSCSYVENGYTVPEFTLLEEDYRTDRFQDWIVHAAAVTAACPRQVLTFYAACSRIKLSAATKKGIRSFWRHKRLQWTSRTSGMRTKTVIELRSTLSKADFRSNHMVLPLRKFLHKWATRHLFTGQRLHCDLG
jgi:hypothetical protein